MHLSKLNHISEQGKNLIIVISDNKWLYLGISFLYPSENVVHISFGLSPAIEDDIEYSQVVVVVDSLVLIKSVWSKCNSLMNKYQKVELVWLYNDKTGLIHPKIERGYRLQLLHANSSPEHIYITISGCIKKSKQKKRNVLNNHLTNTERRIIELLTFSFSYSMIAKTLNISDKTVYAHVRNIIQKTGIKRVMYMRLLLNKGCITFF